VLTINGTHRAKELNKGRQSGVMEKRERGKTIGRNRNRVRGNKTKIIERSGTGERGGGRRHKKKENFSNRGKRRLPTVKSGKRKNPALRT